MKIRLGVPKSPLSYVSAKRPPATAPPGVGQLRSSGISSSVRQHARSTQYSYTSHPEATRHDPCGRSCGPRLPPNLWSNRWCLQVSTLDFSSDLVEPNLGPSGCQVGRNSIPLIVFLDGTSWLAFDFHGPRTASLSTALQLTMVTPSAPQAGNSANSYRDQQDSILQVLLACYVLLLLCRFHPRLSSIIEPANRQPPTTTATTKRSSCGWT